VSSRVDAKHLRCGYTDNEFEHWALWVDIPYEVAFGHVVPPIIRAAARGLKLEDPRVVAQYQKSLETYLVSHHLIQRCNALVDKSYSEIDINEI
jgi:hypothetical protein